MIRLSVVFVVLSALIPGRSFAEGRGSSSPSLAGYVTRIASPSDFDVDGFQVVITSNTLFQGAKDTSPSSTNSEQVFFGECADVYGRIDSKHHRIEAARIVFCRFDSKVLSGSAVVDHLIQPVAQGDLILRADGYPIHVTPSTHVTYVPPLSSLADVQTNIWIKYQGTLASDGSILADKILFYPNNVSQRENKLRQKNEFDPSAVPSDSEQSALSKHFLGLDPKKIPPYKNPAMQSRVDQIGASLVPFYQRHLKSDEPSKITFRFQLIDNPKLDDALALPNGIILIPRQVVERMQNDSQLAAVIADSIAVTLEKQNFRLAPAHNTTNGAVGAAYIGEAFVPGLGAASLIAKSLSDKSIKFDLMEQSGRVSLGLLHDAGYDLQQAPLAWWILASKPAQNLLEVEVPSRSLNLYRTIGLIWRNYPGRANPVNPASAN
jgi:hypothetical protein